MHSCAIRNLNQIDYLRAAWAEDKPDLAYVNVIYLGGDQFFPAYDMSIRIWARKAPAVAAAVGRIDDAWVDVLKELFISQGFDETEAFVRARINFFHQIGYYALAVKESVEERARLVPYYYRILAGKEASPKLHAILNDFVGKQRRAENKKAAATAAEQPPARRRKTRANTPARTRA